MPGTAPDVMPSGSKGIARIGLAAAALLPRAAWVDAAPLPTQVYTIADGLPRDSVLRIVRDPRGFLWFCTPDGLARFDGYRFATYGVARRLPDSYITDVLVTRGGTYWVGTRAGPVSFDPHGGAQLFGP